MRLTPTCYTFATPVFFFYYNENIQYMELAIGKEEPLTTPIPISNFNNAKYGLKYLEYEMARQHLNSICPGAMVPLQNKN